jgi:hypothetical protein
MASIHGESLTPVAGVDAPYNTLRMSLWPQKCLGEYRLSKATGLMAGVGALADIFQFRWTDANNLCAIKFIKVRYAVITGFTAAQELGFDAIPSTAWITSGTGGTQVVPSTTNLVKRTTYPISKVGDIRIATTAALGNGGKTLSNESLLGSNAKTLAAAATVQDAAFEETLDMTSSFDAPLILNQNEGFSVRNTIAMGAGGTVRATVQVAWAEFLAANYPTL